MWRGGRPGHHLRGGRPGIDTPAGTPDIHFFRHGGLAYSWGRHTWETLEAGNYVTVSNTLICLPQIFARPCTIASLYYKNLSGIGDGLRFGIYGNRTEGVLYPGRRLWSSADYLPSNIQSIATAPSLGIDDAGLFWLVIQANTGGTQTRGQFSNEMLTLGGLPLAAWTSNNAWSSDATLRPFVGWSVPYAYALGLPAEVPIGGSETTLLTHNAAGIGYALPQLGFTLSGLGG